MICEGSGRARKVLTGSGVKDGMRERKLGLEEGEDVEGERRERRKRERRERRGVSGRGERRGRREWM